jgi:hypothetical protein
VTRAAALGPIAALALALGGCGSSSLSTPQLRSAATRICAAATRRIDRIPTPTSPTGGTLFLKQGVAALTPELTALRRLSPPTDAARVYSTALTATSKELDALRTTLHELEAGGDPVTLIKTLQHLLTPLESQANSAWETLQIPGCISR